jgi:uroporphyrinogen decarboxylase
VNPDRKPLLRALGGQTCGPPPIWLMRQAGRYLPEYRATRARGRDFLDVCLTPELAVEITLQPIRRYGLDGAIMFSDILIVPHALGQKVWFVEGTGPKLEPLRRAEDVERLSPGAMAEALAPVYETLRRLRGELPPEVTLIGFAGAPWTVASYMVEGGSSKDFAGAKTWAYGAPEEFARLIDLLVAATADYLIAQVEAGAEALQIFDSWAGVWPQAELRRWCLEPVKEIVRRVKAAHPDIPIIVFPRGVGVMYDAFAREVGADALSLDTTVPLDWAREHLPATIALQGNLDPLFLVAGGEAQKRATHAILEALAERPFVFNLGHGITPQASTDHVAELIAQVRAWQPKS